MKKTYRVSLSITRPDLSTTKTYTVEASSRNEAVYKAIRTAKEDFPTAEVTFSGSVSEVS